MILLDTNVLLYAVGGDHPLRAPCKSIVGAVGSSAIEGVVTDIILAEFLHGRSRRTSRQEATALVASIVGFVADVLPVTPAARDQALAIYLGSERLSSNDAFIAAVALDAGATLVSADRDFHDVIRLDLVEPATLAAELAP